jgi:hypothetical protein
MGEWMHPSKLMYSFGKSKRHYELGFATDRKNKDRLTNYYKKHFQI